MNFAEDIAWILIVCAIVYPPLRDIFRACPLLQEKDAERERLHGFSKSDRHRTAEDSDQAFLHYFMIYQYEYMGYVYQKNTGIDWPIIRRRRRSELRWRFTLTHLIRKNTSVPPMSRCIG